MQAVTRVNAEQAFENDNAQADSMTLSGKADTAGKEERMYAQSLRRGSGDSMYTRKSARNTGGPTAWSGMINRTPARDGPGADAWRDRHSSGRNLH